MLNRLCDLFIVLIIASVSYVFLVGALEAKTSIDISVFYHMLIPIVAFIVAAICHALCDSVLRTRRQTRTQCTICKKTFEAKNESLQGGQAICPGCAKRIAGGSGDGKMLLLLFWEFVPVWLLTLVMIWSAGAVLFCFPEVRLPEKELTKIEGTCQSKSIEKSMIKIECRIGESIRKLSVSTDMRRRLESLEVGDRFYAIVTSKGEIRELGEEGRPLFQEEHLTAAMRNTELAISAIFLLIGVGLVYWLYRKMGSALNAIEKERKRLSLTAT
ncbi:hypothetical protein LOC68_07110 [Blastopirellula sp. JC732]|uniref:Uncharacterized protein n=1 Tax=Blastopirellula sediminis TaxID=2894196 RepID=A0A9X1MME7_9BACT|nr:hypothetical protein [Blastopirellula sediminis]MCC9609064.1 hypothetical protein [Blastopirellula sediminis]MCC9628159.1 hypothetical protein [Blastopirellula sediminis]